MHLNFKYLKCYKIYERNYYEEENLIDKTNLDNFRY